MQDFPLFRVGAHIKVPTTLGDARLLSNFSPPLPSMALFSQSTVAGFATIKKVFLLFFDFSGIKKVP